ncbi:adenylate/guanylate cyclase domain-containing protein [Treponema socranskii]|uniref:adenylate/guanylate cyclase domain-containing protein n=1 Tax=Treponema socranskii TaxID=53419 RepID=UPI00056E4642
MTINNYDEDRIRKNQKNGRQIAASPLTFRVLSLVVLAELMLFPFSMNRMDLFHPEQTSRLLFPFTVLLSGTVTRGFNFFYICCLSFFLLPITFIITVLSFFRKEITKPIVYLCLLVSLTFYLAASVCGIILFADTARWFSALSPLAYIAFFSAFILHSRLITVGIISIKAQNESYVEYKELLNEEEKKEAVLRKKAAEKLKRRKKNGADALESFDTVKAVLKEWMHRVRTFKIKTRIKTKITVVILLTILVILSTFIYTDLKNYKMLVSQTADNTGKNLAEQVAAIYDFSDGLHTKISAFLEGIKKTNASSPFPCQRADIITTSSKSNVFLDEIDYSTELPEFDVFSYTTAAVQINQIPAEEKRILPSEAIQYITHYQNINTRGKPICKSEKDTCIYVYPVTFSRREGQKLVGFSVVTYLKEVLNRPYFQAKVFILSISVIFFYVSIIVTLFLADFIVNPVLFLCGNIRKTANSLSDMLAGNAKIESGKLIFEETVHTNDEIKNLSVEIKNIVSLVRGMLPYVSFHTVQNAEKKAGRLSTTRELCFLFTDIRGFTSLCEKVPPKEVIRLLNHYLDIETKIIFDNDGDVDKYVGDEIMAFFSGPKKEINACKAAMEIRKAMYREKQLALEKGAAAIAVGIGINSGSVVFGSVGSETRKDFTSIGDTVNLAARLESANKEYGSKSIISETVYKKLGKDFVCRELDYITVKGKTKPVRIYEVLQSKEGTTDKILDLKRTFETGLSYYRKRKWQHAKKYFSENAKKYNDAPSKVFLKRIERYQVSPPKQEWKGVFVMTGK